MGEKPPDRGGEDRKLTFEWTEFPDGERALVFDKKTWAALQEMARQKGAFAEHLISKAVLEACGTLLMDNYVLNRFTRTDNR
jgi:hypothetical protein